MVDRQPHQLAVHGEHERPGVDACARGQRPHRTWPGRRLGFEKAAHEDRLQRDATAGDDRGGQVARFAEPLRHPGHERHLARVGDRLGDGEP
jgi:hypothetical protein